MIQHIFYLGIKEINPFIKKFNSQQYKRTEYTPLDDVICVIRSSNPNRRVSSSFQGLFEQKSSVFNTKTNWVFSYIGPPNSQLKMKSVCMMKIDIHKDLPRNNNLQETLLHKAVTIGNLEVVKFLVQQNITIDARNIHGETPLHYASRLGNLEIVKVLTNNQVSNSEFNAAESLDNLNETPLVKAFKNGHLEVVKYFAPPGIITEKSRENEIKGNGKDKMCTPIKKIVYAKTQKTGSSTLQNIFVRYGLKNKLKFALPNNPRMPWSYGLDESFQENMVKQYKWKNCEEYHMMLWHGIYNISETEKIIPKNDISKRITILRDPVSMFESGYAYNNLDEWYGMDINQFAQNIFDNGFPPRKKGTNVKDLFSGKKYTYYEMDRVY